MSFDSSTPDRPSHPRATTLLRRALVALRRPPMATRWDFLCDRRAGIEFDPAQQRLTINLWDRQVEVWLYLTRNNSRYD